MKEPFSPVKIRPPQLSHILYRNRLLDRLDSNKDKKLIFILGQAAQGKTTLAASFSEKCLRSSAWINLTEEESDPLNLFRLIVRSIQHVNNDSDFSDLLRYVALDLGPRAEKPLYRSWVQTCMEKIISPIQIIFDGIERLSIDAPSMKLISVFIEEANANTRYILLSRHEPSIEVQKYKIRQEALVIDNEQLAFTRDETIKYLVEIHKLKLPLKTYTKIHEMTEGWIGGLLLVSEAIKGNPDFLKKTPGSEDLISKFKKESYRYIGNEIFDSLPYEVKQLLVKSSFLEIIDPAILKDVFEVSKPQMILKELSGKNLFIQSIIDENNRSFYRYHQMFKGFLRNRFHAETSKKERQLLYTKAAHVFQQIGDNENALKNYLMAKEFNKAADVLATFGNELITIGRINDLANWLSDIPDDIVQKNAWLVFYFSITRRFTAARENTLAFMKCLKMFEDADDIRGQILTFAYLIEAYSLGGYHPIPIKIITERAEQLLKSLPQDKYRPECAVLWSQLGQCMTVSCGNPRKGFWCCKKAYIIAESFGGVGLQFSAMNSAVEALAWLGEFKIADEVCSKIDKLLKSNVYSEMHAYRMITLAGLSMLRGETTKARVHIQQAYALIEKHGLMFYWAPALAADLFITVYSGDLEKAENIAGQMIDLAKSIGNKALEAIAMLDIAWIHYRKSEWKLAKDYIETCVEVLISPECLTLYHYHAAIVIKSRIACAVGDLNSAEAELQATINYLSTIPDYLVIIDAHICMAIIKNQRNDFKNAKLHLAEGFRLAEYKDHYHLALISREDFADMCILALRLFDEKERRYPLYLLSTCLSDLAEPKLVNLERISTGDFKSEVVRFRRAIYANKLPRLRIQCFPELRVWRGDKIVEESEWTRAHPKLLLKAIISRGARQIPRDVLIEDLWPEIQTSAGEKNFKVTLHRLRKVLEPEMNKSFGSMYLTLHENYLSLQREFCIIDVVEFEELYKKGEEQEKSGNQRKAIHHYKKAIELQNGNFFEKDLYLPYVGQKRDELTVLYINILFRTAGLYEKQNKLKSAIKCYQMIVQKECTTVEAYQKLISVFSKCGMKTAAIRTFNDYSKMLREQLDCEPDKSTKAILRKITEK
jgi:LuxR family transcriptional regulator, maltose regulon positive regulatory protein